MFKSSKGILTALAVTALLLMSAVVIYAQQTTGSVTMTATVSNFVELNSGGAVTLTGNSGGSVITDGTANSPLAVVVDMGELGPINSNSFVKLSVPLKLRSNVAYQLNMATSVAGAGATSFSLKDTDVGFGLTPAARPANLAPNESTNRRRLCEDDPSVDFRRVGFGARDQRLVDEEAQCAPDLSGGDLARDLLLQRHGPAITRILLRGQNLIWHFRGPRTFLL